MYKSYLAKGQLKLAETVTNQFDDDELKRNLKLLCRCESEFYRGRLSIRDNDLSDTYAYLVSARYPSDLNWIPQYVQYRLKCIAVIHLFAEKGTVYARKGKERAEEDQADFHTLGETLIDALGITDDCFQKIVHENALLILHLELDVACERADKQMAALCLLRLSHLHSQSASLPSFLESWASGCQARARMIFWNTGPIMDITQNLLTDLKDQCNWTSIIHRHAPGLNGVRSISFDLGPGVNLRWGDEIGIILLLEGKAEVNGPRSAVITQDDIRDCTYAGVDAGRGLFVCTCLKGKLRRSTRRRIAQFIGQIRNLNALPLLR